MKFMSVAITSENYKIQFSAKRKDKSWGLKDKKMFWNHLCEEYDRKSTIVSFTDCRAEKP